MDIALYQHLQKAEDQMFRQLAERIEFQPNWKPGRRSPDHPPPLRNRVGSLALLDFRRSNELNLLCVSQETHLPQIPPEMKKNHSPGGARIFMRVLFYSFVFLAVIGTRESLSDGNGPVSNNLGMACNRVLMCSSKLGLGLALLNSDKRGEDTMIGRYSHALGIASHKAFVSAAKVDIFAR